MNGSSPRVWGTCCRTRATERGSPVHPHVCGEHAAPRLFNRRKDGSSPRVWGTCRCGRVQRRYDRFIPTCVGNMEAYFMYLFCQTVHPHVCGEHVPFAPAARGFFGSSPRVWGTLCETGNYRLLLRFIPTCVGNISNETSNPLSRPVHPHVCGEHLTNCLFLKYPIGSSPRVWGTYLS